MAVDQAADLARRLEPFAGRLDESPIEKIAKDLAPLSKVLEESAVARIGKDLAGFDLAGAEALAEMMKPMEEHRKTLERLRAIFPAGIESSEYSVSAEHLPESPTIQEFRLPPNPTHKTNQHLARLTEKTEALFDVQAEQATLIDSLLQAQIESAKSQDRMARKQYFVAIMGILIAVIAVIVTAI